MNPVTWIWNCQTSISFYPPRRTEQKTLLIGTWILSKLDFENKDSQRTRESVLRVLRKVVDLSDSNLQKNADKLFATKPHKNEDILWIGESGKRVPENLFALSY